MGTTMPYVITCGPDGDLYEWYSGIRITPDGTEAIPQEMHADHGVCPTCGFVAELRYGLCIPCFLEGPDVLGSDDVFQDPA